MEKQHNLITQEWSRFVTIVKQQHKLDEVSYHKLFDILKQYQKEVNELRTQRIDRNANPLALVATAQLNQDPYYQTPKPHKPYAPTSKASIPTRSHATTRNKGKEIAKPITPPSKSASEEDSDPEQAQRDKDMQKKLALIVKYFKKIYKSTNNNLRTYSNSINKNVDTTPRLYISQGKMFLCKQAEQGVPLQAEHVDWLADMNKEIDEQELEAHYSFMAKIQEVVSPESNSNAEPLEQNEFEKYKACNGCIVDYDKLELKLNETLGLLAQKDIDIKESLKLKAYEISVVKEKHDELVKQSLLTKSHYEGLVKEKIKTQNDSLAFVHELKQEIHADLNELKKLIKKCKVKSVETKFDKPSVVRQPNAQRIPKPSVLRKLALFLDSLKRKSFSKIKSVPKTNVSEGLSKPVTTQILHQIAKQAVSNTKVIKPCMYRIDNRTTQTRAPQLPQTSRNTNPRMSTSTGVAQKTNVSRPHLRSNQLTDKVVPNNSHVKAKKTKVEDHHRISSISNKNSLTKEANVVPISTRKPKSQAKKSVATPHKKTVAPETTTQKLKSYYRMLHEKKSTVHFSNDQFALILGYGDLVQGNITINRVYYVEGLDYNLFLVGQFCDADLEVAFRKSTWFVRDLQGNDLLIGNRGSDLYTNSLQESNRSTPICLMAKASPTHAWLWHQRLSHLNFDYINLLSKKDVVIGLPKLKYFKDQLCSSCEVSKAKRSSFKTKIIPISKGRLNLLHMDLCGPMRVTSINGKKYILEEGIEYQTSTPRTPEQNGVVERRKCTLVEAARTMLSALKLP
nr:retrovirus-related Pol polyprotein from transposon TNT 1-94 [Tanacetum cinerariifolium]